MRNLSIRLGALSLVVAACSAPVEMVDTGTFDGADAPGIADAFPDHQSDTIVSTDVPPDQRSDAADAADATVVDLGCLGDTRPITISQGLPFISVRVGNGTSPPAGDFLIDVATTRSAIDLAAFGSNAPPASACNPSALGQACMFADLDFFGSWGGVTLITENLSGLGGAITEAGIIGTDFTSTFALTIDYRGHVARQTTRAALCTDEVLTTAGFAALSSMGFYARDTTTLRPMHDVDSTAGSGVIVPNVPTVNINTALFDAIAAAHPSALIRNAALDLSLSTCVPGVSEPVEAYQLAPGGSLDFVSMGGTAATSFTDVIVFVKRTPSAARTCGGIGTWTVPAAQIAASFFVAIGTLVFDPFSSRVWISTR